MKNAKKRLSYYDIMTLMKNGQPPKKLYLYRNNKKAKYILNEEDGYILAHPQNENYLFSIYLKECLLDRENFDECIEIIKE